MRLLLDVESPDNPIEIVIHVNMLKEGGMSTIFILSSAQNSGIQDPARANGRRGLRLPYGERTGDRNVDAVMLTAHDKFADILAEAQRG